MIVWIASYPRSGNAFFRILLHQISGLPTYSVYSTLKTKNRSMALLMGHLPLPYSLEEMYHSSDLFFVKTHELPSDNSPAIYLIRDGRDSLISYAHFILDNHSEHCYDREFEEILTDVVIHLDYYGGWSKHILSWTQRQAPTIILRFEYLIQHPKPQEIIKYIFQELNINQDVLDYDKAIPKFNDFKKIKPKHFRCGKIGQWETEMPMEIQKQFWQIHGYAMQKNGYSKHTPFLSMGLEFFDGIAREKAKIATFQASLLDKENTIQNISFFLKFSPAYWISIYLRPLLKKLLPEWIVGFIRRGGNPLSLEPQFQPRPIKLPPSYTQSKYISLNDRVPCISIVTPSYNQMQFIPQTIESVLDQDYPNLEYVIQDGASTDGTAEVLQRYTQAITHIESAPDAGQAHAINLGFQKTQGEIMAWLNADDLLLPGTLHYVAEFFQNNLDVDVVYGHRILINEQGQEFSRWLLPPHENEMLSWADYIPQETLFWRRELWDRVGGSLDQSYRFAMDWELLLRFRAAGAKFVRLPRFLGAFRVHAQQKTQALYDVGEEEMNRLRWSQHGSSLSRFKVDQEIQRYLRRANWYRFLNKIKILRH